jgi:ribonuclease P protein subunit RPR2
MQDRKNHDLYCQRVYHIQAGYIIQKVTLENRMAGRSKSGEIKRLARERITVLFQRAEEFFPQNPAWSDRCVVLARRIAMRQRVGLEWQQRRKICPHCYRFHVPGVTMRVRIKKGKVVVTCLHCHRQSRFPTGRLHESV